MYKVFNPLTGIYSSFTTREEAISGLQTIKDDFLEQQLPYRIITKEEFVDDKNVANEYAAINFGEAEVSYLYTDYNVSQDQQISHMFASANYWFKVENQNVVEVYEMGGKIGDIRHDAVCLDVETQEPISYYNYTPNKSHLIKYDLQGNEVNRYFFKYEEMEEQHKTLLNNFHITCSFDYWTIKNNELFVGFILTKTRLLDELTAEEKAIIDYKRTELLNNTNFSVNQVSVNENGDETWVGCEL